MTKKNTILNCKRYFLLLPVILGLLFVGCQNQDPEIQWINNVYEQNYHIPYNPKMVFDAPRKNARQASIPAEAFGRADWPISEHAIKSHYSREVIVYSERFSYQTRIDRNGIPYIRLNSHLYGYRDGVVEK